MSGDHPRRQDHPGAHVAGGSAKAVFERPKRATAQLLTAMLVSASFEIFITYSFL